MGDSRKKVAPRTETEDDGIWTWISFAPEPKLIIDFIIGPKKRYVADEFIEVTDGLKLYAEALLKKYGEWGEFPKTGKRRRSKKPAIMPRDLRYAQVVKNKKRKKQKVEKRVIFGQNRYQSKISANLLERQNLTFRQDNNRISRKIIGFSKKVKGLYNQMRFYCTHFNFCRDRRGLTNEKGVLEKKTPAQECGITKKNWKLTELLNYRFLKISTN